MTDTIGPDGPPLSTEGWEAGVREMSTDDLRAALRQARKDGADMPDHLTDAEQWALDELADLSIDYPAVVQAAADRLIPTATVRPEARARFLAAADRALAVRRADLGPLPKVLAEVDYLRAVESAARYLMTAPNRAVEENAHSVLYCALKLCGPDGCVNCREGA